MSLPAALDGGRGRIVKRVDLTFVDPAASSIYFIHDPTNGAAVDFERSGWGQYRILSMTSGVEFSCSFFNSEIDASDFELTVENPFADDAGQRLFDWGAQYGWGGAYLSLRYYVQAPDGTWSQQCHLQDFRVDEVVDVTAASFTIRCLPHHAYRAASYTARRLDIDNCFDEVDRGRVVPAVYASVIDLEVLRKSVRKERILDMVGNSSSVVHVAHNVTEWKTLTLNSVEGLAATGYIVLRVEYHGAGDAYLGTGDAVYSYGNLNAANRTIELTAFNYDWPSTPSGTAHRAAYEQTPVYLIESSNSALAAVVVADRPVTSPLPRLVNAEDDVIPAAEMSVNTAHALGTAIGGLKRWDKYNTVLLDGWKARTSGTVSDNAVYGTVGTPIVRPDRVIKHILCDRLGYAFSGDADSIDDTTFDASGTSYDTEGTFSPVLRLAIREDCDLMQLCQEIAWAWSSWLYWEPGGEGAITGKWKLVKRQVSRPAAADGVIYASLLSEPPVFNKSASADEVNDVTVLFGHQWDAFTEQNARVWRSAAAGTYGGSVRRKSLTVTAGTRAPRHLDFDVKSLPYHEAHAVALARAILYRRHRSTRLATVRGWWNLIACTPGTTWSLSGSACDDLYFVERQLIDLDAGTVELSLRQWPLMYPNDTDVPTS